MDSVNNEVGEVKPQAEKAYEVAIPQGVFSFVARSLGKYYKGQIEAVQRAGYFKGLYDTSGSDEPESEESRLLRLMSTFPERLPNERGNALPNKSTVAISAEDIDYIDSIIPYHSGVVEMLRRSHINELKIGLEEAKIGKMKVL